MTKQALAGLARHVRLIADPKGNAGPTDQQLLDDWIQSRDEAAFELLVRRHGPMVLASCRRILAHAHDAEDAFQATFLALARKARSIRRPNALAGWLYQVACRSALRLRSRTPRETDVLPSELPASNGDPATAAIWRDVRRVLDEEIDHLPARYRLPFVLCYLEGKTNDEAAHHLGCPTGTVMSRLAWARDRLRSRLTRRGVTLSAAVLAGLLTHSTAPAAVPGTLINTTVGVALFSAGKLAAGAASTQVAVLTEGVLKSMFLNKVKMAAAGFVCLAGLGTGVGAAGYRLIASEQAPGGAAVVASTKRTIRVASQRDGFMAAIATEIKPGEEGALDRVVTVLIGGQPRKLRRLKRGDLIEEGQAVAFLHDQLAADEVAMRHGKIRIAEAEYIAAEKSRDETQSRYYTQLRLEKSHATSPEDVRGALFTWQKLTQDAVKNKEAIELAKLELKSAQTVLDMHTIRSPANGVICAIHKHPGEAVRMFDTVLEIQVDDQD
jgi:RNA polymerase sigma factor (sigma-70 family)